MNNKKKKSSTAAPKEEQALIDGHKLSVESPEWAAAQTIGWTLYGKQLFSHEKATGLLPILVDNAAQVKTGDLLEVERILLSQAEVLQAFFNKTLGVAALMMDNPENCDRYAALAFRAQDQCRKTLVALAELKNPKKPTQFIKNYVDKQLNQLKVEQPQAQTERQAVDKNSASVDNPSTIPQSLEILPHASLDTRSQATTERTNPVLETVEILNGANNREWESDQLPKCH
jgi:hypothetical protein